MSRNYDNWERLVAATLDRENLRELARSPSIDTSSFRSSIWSPSTSFNFELPSLRETSFNPSISDLSDSSSNFEFPSPVKPVGDGRPASDVLTDTNTLKHGSDPTTNLRILIVFYSMYGHVEYLAKRMKRGVDSMDGVEAVIYRVPETLQDAYLSKMKAPPKDDSIPVMESVEELATGDGFLFGFPTRFGCMAAQMKAFFDSTGPLWAKQKLAGKPAGFFVSAGTHGGGQETTAWTAITQLAHHGMLFVPIGYTFGSGMFKMDAPRGGSPYGAGIFVGNGTIGPTETELDMAEHQGKYMAAIVKRLAQG